MIRATTPTHVFTFPNDIDPSECERILITYKQNGQIVFEIEETALDIDGQTVSYTFSQEETNLFSAAANAQVQVRILTSTGDALASDITMFSVRPVLNDEVLQA